MIEKNEMSITLDIKIVEIATLEIKINEESNLHNGVRNQLEQQLAEKDAQISEL